MATTSKWAGVGVVVALCLAGCGQKTEQAPDAGNRQTTPAAEATPAPSGPTAAVAGAVRFDGTPPERKPLKMTADDACAAHHQDAALSEDVIVGASGGLRNVFVVVVGGLEGRTFAPPAAPVVLDQKGCVYTPHVFGVMAKQPISLRNSDPTLHNVHAIPEAGDGEFNIGMPRQGMEIARSFEQPGVVRFKCDVHPWMLSWGIVTAHPYYAITGDDGRYSIAGLPAGEYTIEAWHEKLGTQRSTVTVDPAAGDAAADFAFSAQ